MSDIVKLFSEAPEAMPVTVGPKLIPKTREYVRSSLNFLLGTPAYLAYLPFGIAKTTLTAAGRAALLAASWPLYEGAHLAGKAGDIIFETHDKIVNAIANVGAGGHGTVKGGAHAAPEH